MEKKEGQERDQDHERQIESLKMRVEELERLIDITVMGAIAGHKKRPVLLLLNSLGYRCTLRLQGELGVSGFKVVGGKVVRV